MEQPASHAPGLIGSVSGIFRNTARLVLSRIELAALELTEVRSHLVQLSVVFALALVAGWFAVAFSTATIVFLAWEAMGWKILLILAVAFILLTLWMVLMARGLLKLNKLALPMTMAEIKADRDMLL